MQIKQKAATRFHNIMQRPRIAPVIEFGGQVEGIEGGGDVGNHPEDKPHGCPGLADDHSYVFAGETERNHADPIYYPVHDEGSPAVRVGVIGDMSVRAWGIGEGDLER